MLLKKKLFKLNSILYPITFPIVNFLAQFSSKVTEKFYGLLMTIEWGRNPSPEWMDHDQDYFYQTRAKGKTFFLERGVLPKIFISEIIDNNQGLSSLNILDLCSGDGFYSQFFLHDIAKNITMIDLDPLALDRAKKRKQRLPFLKNKSFNYINADIVSERIENILLKKNIFLKYDVIIFNAAIEHFKEEQVFQILESCKKLMSKKGLIFGYTLVEDEEHVFDHHELLFKTKNDLKKIINKNFKNVECFQSISETRHNLYFLAKNN